MSRIFPTLVLLAISASSAFADCPAWDGQAERFAQLRAEAQVAPDQATGQALSNQMWAIWTKAPDETAQELLDVGMAARESYDYDKAIAAFDALVAYCPDYAEGYNQRAFVNFLRQDFEPALTDLERTLARNPEHVAAKAGMALTLLNMGRFQAGQAVLREALAMNPWLPERGYLVADPAGPDDNAEDLEGQGAED
jgi:tetratricopeptide (TPR) repeat protein